MTNADIIINYTTPLVSTFQFSSLHYICYGVNREDQDRSWLACLFKRIEIEFIVSIVSCLVEILKQVT
jgi:hypothetical protein